MRRTILKYAATLALASVAAAAPLLAQSNTGTDNSWNVAWTGLQSGTSTGTGTAVVVNPIPSPPWVNTSPNSYWIATNASASLPMGTGDNAHRYDYTFTTSFAPSTSPLLMTVWTDNFFVSYAENGGAPIVATDIPPSPGDFAASARVYTIAAGTHSLTLNTYGDGQTDAVNVAFSSVPEPSSMALLGTGLVGLVPMIRRKRKA